ncbi:putative membrane protein [Dyadobacter jejuensis]|uniref:Putative membrane protein n=1 Tax=Dyadobacter jejuensis TaxID=1082580 RepID=A0A316APH8_9BACT|nr:c-type cytochrome domain-containing protein [Dyadobacter jejuensis]PWJ58720.1 putative membrane protein [Dyadobacter jejuensis]
MNKKYRLLAEQILLAQLIFTSFIILFEKELVLPPWAQAAGRLHPLLLHFPIVLLLMAFLMAIFKPKDTTEFQSYYHRFQRSILCLAVGLSGITVLMGIFLAQEQGYQGELLFWHKWTGVAIYYFGTVLYFLNYWPLFRNKLQKGVSVLGVALLMMTGHFGASLTHGENFLLDPLTTGKEISTVPLDSALVFEHIIQPILQQKCVSCHNEDKVKGELMLTDLSSILKGGKSGKLFIPGNPQMSLLLERIHMPMEEKKHMPPSGKVQLTKAESRMLYHWVSTYGSSKAKVVDLPLSDSLRILAMAFLKPKAVEVDRFDFDEADPDLVKDLNSDYRTVAHLASDSPALTVNIYNKSQYTVKQIEELAPIAQQVVALNLNKLPIQDADLAAVAKLKNLRRLDLNFTDITASGLSHLQALGHLHTLSLSGTQLEIGPLEKQLAGLKALKQLTVWDTGLDVGALENLEKKFVAITFIKGFQDDGASPLQLNPIQVNNASMVFNDNLEVQLFHPIKGTEIRYSTDGSVPDSVTSDVYKTLVIDKNTFIKARAFKKGWYGSETSSFDFLKNTYIPDSVRLSYVLNRVHKAAGAHTFFDGKLGQIGANNPAWANYWAGVRDTDLELYAEFKKPVALSSVGVHYMVEEDTGIFPPDQIEVWGATQPGAWKILSRFQAPKTSKGETPSIRLVEGRFNTTKVAYLKIIAKPVYSIPSWSRRKGNKALLLVDEMFLN